MFEDFHKLLRKQIEKLFPAERLVDGKLMELFNAINDSYLRFETEINELKSRNDTAEEKIKSIERKLKNEIEKGRTILEDLKASLLVLDDGNPAIADADDSNFLSRVLVDLVTKHSQVEEQLKSRTQEMELLNKVMIGRELKMVELKKEILRLEESLAEVKYKANSE